MTGTTGFYWAFLLSKEEAGNGNNKGYAYAFANKDRWIPIDNVIMDGTFDSPNIGTMHVVKNNVVYHVYKDYVLLDENKRLFICYERGLSADVIPKDESEEKSNDTTINNNENQAEEPTENTGDSNADNNETKTE